MGTHEQHAGRGAALVALAFGVLYLGWRLTTIPADVVWVGAVTWAIEVVGLLAVGVLTWALWSAPVHRRPETIDAVVDVVVRSDGSPLAPLRATVLSSQHLGHVSVLDLRARPEVAALALELGAGYLATDADDLDGLGFALDALRASTVLLLEAGDVPRPDVLDDLLPWLDDPTVAIVQGMVVAASGESAEHGSGGRHDKEFERRGLGPSLGARGLARFSGSGALIRTAPVRALALPAASTPVVEAQITAGLFADGWRIVAPGGSAVVAVSPISSPNAVETVRAREASAARAVVFGPQGALRFNRLRVTHRLALIAHSVRPLGGLRRTAVIAVLLASLLSGRVPIHASTSQLLMLWGPWFALSALALWALSDGSLRPGDRVRSSMRVLGASWRGVLAPDGRPDDAKHTLTGAFGLHHGAASAVAVAAIGVVVGLRALSDRFTHTLAPMETTERAALLVVALWSLGGGLDALRLLARRAQTRRATRVVASLPSEIGGRSAIVVDLTPLGAGVLGEVDLEVGAEASLDVVLPTATGCVSASLPVVVRNARLDLSGEPRVGVEFGAVEGYEADALVEFCIVQPALDSLGASHVDVTGANVRPVTVLDDRALGPRRIGLRAAALVAVIGALSSSLPTAADAAGVAVSVMRGEVVVASAVTAADPSATSTTPETTPETSPESGPETSPANSLAPSSTTPMSIDLTASTVPAVAPDSGATSPASGAVVRAVCSLDAGADGVYGTSDDDYGAPVSDVVSADGTYDLPLDGAACWFSAAPPAGFMVSPDSSSLESLATPQVLDLGSGRAPRIELVPVVESPSPADASATLADVVWADLDGDRVVDPEEPLIAGVTVSLYDRRGAVAGTTTTDADGAFAFQLPVGTYQLGVSNLPAGYVAGPRFADPLGRTEPFQVTADGDVDLAVGLLPVAVAGSEFVRSAGGSGPLPIEVLARPSDTQTVPTPAPRSTLPGLVVVLLATVIGLSVLAGSLRPGRSRPVVVR